MRVGPGSPAFGAHHEMVSMPKIPSLFIYKHLRITTNFPGTTANDTIMVLYIEFPLLLCYFTSLKA
jgi:hypothetical protein